MRGIRYHAAAYDGSGYAEAARTYLRMLHGAGCPLRLHAVCHDRGRSDLRQSDALLHRLERAKTPYDINLIHLTPEHYPLLAEKGKLNIGHFVWETDRLPRSWVEHLGHVDAVFTSSSWNREVIGKDLPRMPVFVIPHGLDLDLFGKTEPLRLDRLEDRFVFLSVYKWHERKNPAALLRAYWIEFATCRDVVLVLRTFLAGHGPGEKELLLRIICQLEAEVGLARCELPEVLLVCSWLPDRTLAGLLGRADVLVLLTRGEGFGLPLAQAMAAGTPCIATAHGGQLDFLTPHNSYLVGYRLVPVTGMPHSPWYRPWQRWAD